MKYGVPGIGPLEFNHASPVDEHCLTPATLTTLPNAKERGKVYELPGKLEQIKASMVRLAELPAQP
jgi:hypothetical protein